MKKTFIYEDCIIQIIIIITIKFILESDNSKTTYTDLWMLNSIKKKIL